MISFGGEEHHVIQVLVKTTPERIAAMLLFAAAELSAGEVPIERPFGLDITTPSNPREREVRRAELFAQAALVFTKGVGG